MGKGFIDIRIHNICYGFAHLFKKLERQQDSVIIQEERNLQIYKLRIDAATCWESGYDIMESVETNGVILSDDYSPSHLITFWQDCNVLQSIAAALKTMKAMKDPLAGKQCVNIIINSEINIC